MTWIRAITIAIGALLVLVPAAVAKVPRDFVGIESQETFQKTFNNDPDGAAEDLSAQAAVRIRIHRQLFNWELIEREPGVYDFSFVDRYMTEMAEHGMRVLPVLFDAPPWHEGEGQELDKGIHAPPSSGKPLGDFGAALARRYGPSGSFWDGMPGRFRRVSAIRAWQIWNEPNLRQYWGGDPNAREYVRVLKQAVKRIRRVEPKAEIVTAGIPQSSLFKAVPLRRYTKQMYKAGAKKWFDTFGLNAYAKNRKDCRRKVDLVRRVMNKRRDRKAKIWITEIGWADTGNEHYLVKGPRGQARQIRKVIPLIARLRKSRRLRGFIYYMWRDIIPNHREGVDPGTWGWHTGLLRTDGSAKPAFGAFKDVVADL
jgi:hypothetical protein